MSASAPAPAPRGLAGVGGAAGRLLVVDPAKTGETTFGHHGEGLAEGGGREAVAEDQSLGASLPFARRHRLVRHEEIMQASGTGEAKLVGGVQQAGAVLQQGLRVIEREGLQEGLRRDAGEAAEEMVEMRFRQADMRRDLVETGLPAPAGRHVFQRPAHAIIVRRLLGKHGQWLFRNLHQHGNGLPDWLRLLRALVGTWSIGSSIERGTGADTRKLWRLTQGPICLFEMVYI